MMVLYHSVGPESERPSFTGALEVFRFESRPNWICRHGEVDGCRTSLNCKAIDAVIAKQLGFRVGGFSHVG